MKNILLILISMFTLSCSKKETEKASSQETAYLQYLKNWINETSKDTEYSVQDIQLLKKDSVTEIEIAGFIAHYYEVKIRRLLKQRDKLKYPLENSKNKKEAKLIVDSAFKIKDSIDYYFGYYNKIYAKKHDSFQTAYFNYTVLIKIENKKLKSSRFDSIMVYSPKESPNTIIPSDDLEAHIIATKYK